MNRLPVSGFPGAGPLFPNSEVGSSNDSNPGPQEPLHRKKTDLRPARPNAPLSLRHPTLAQRACSNGSVLACPGDPESRVRGPRPSSKNAGCAEGQPLARTPDRPRGFSWSRHRVTVTITVGLDGTASALRGGGIQQHVVQVVPVRSAVRVVIYLLHVKELERSHPCQLEEGIPRELVDPVPPERIFTRRADLGHPSVRSP